MTEPTFRSDMRVDLIDFMGGDGRVVQAARTSTLGAAASEEKESAGLINFLVRERHHVPLEHSKFTFRLEIPIFVSRQLVKHRTAQISEESGRYREMDGEFYIPSEGRPLAQTGKTGQYNMIHLSEHEETRLAVEMVRASQRSWASYENMLRNGAAKEVARMVLPVNLYSSMYFTIDARNLMHFLSLRNEHHAQRETREVAEKMEEFFAESMPLTYAAWRSDE